MDTKKKKQIRSAVVQITLPKDRVPPSPKLINRSRTTIISDSIMASINLLQPMKVRPTLPRGQNLMDLAPSKINSPSHLFITLLLNLLQLQFNRGLRFNQKASLMILQTSGNQDQHNKKLQETIHFKTLAASSSMNQSQPNNNNKNKTLSVTSHHLLHNNHNNNLDSHHPQSLSLLRLIIYWTLWMTQYHPLLNNKPINNLLLSSNKNKYPKSF